MAAADVSGEGMTEAFQCLSPLMVLELAGLHLQEPLPAQKNWDVWVGTIWGPHLITQQPAPGPCPRISFPRCWAVSGRDTHNSLFFLIFLADVRSDPGELFKHP